MLTGDERLDDESTCGCNATRDWLDELTNCTVCLIRVYRYGQKKQTHIYRLVSVNTMEKKIYDRQVSKQGVASKFYHVV